MLEYVLFSIGFALAVSILILFIVGAGSFGYAIGKILSLLIRLLSKRLRKK